MEPITLGLIFLLGGLGLHNATKKSKGEAPESIKEKVYSALKDASMITIPPLESWVEIEFEGSKYLVAPRYIAPVGIGEAQRIARENNAMLPFPALVDEIWRQADLKLAPRPRGPSSNPPSDYTKKTMNSPEANINQLAIIDKQIQDSDNPNYKLLAGTHKDVVFGKNYKGEEKLGIYGWHQLDGKPIQGFMWGHAANEDNPELDWKDYSQGLRLVRKIS